MLGAFGCVILIMVAGAATQLEFYELLRKIGQRPLAKIGAICGFPLMVGELWPCVICQKLSPSTSELLFAAMVIVIVKVLLTHSLEMSKKCIISTIAGIIYAPFMCHFPIALLKEITMRNLSGKCYVSTLLWMVFVAKCCDIGGMFAGKYYGQRKLAPRFSPRKTVEGLMGGILLSNFVGMISMLLMKNLLPSGINLLRTAIMSTLLAIFALVGDLLESAIKRLAKEKDSGNIFPGIGGAFDLTDSLLFSIPVGVIFLKYFVL
jgi:phosphatidate cytidylyltransferase